MRIETISYLKKNAADLSVEEPMVVTQNGKPAYVVEDYAQRKYRDDAIALLKLTSFAKKDFEKGDLLDSEELKRQLTQGFNS